MLYYEQVLRFFFFFFAADIAVVNPNGSKTFLINEFAEFF